MQSIQLDDGRRLHYRALGHPNGHPVIFCHGCPGSFFDADLTEPMASQLGIRIIAPNRPGYGCSDFQVGRKISDWPSDILGLARALGLEKFAILGVSAGAPYALACAEHISNRLTGVGIVSGLGSMGSVASTKGMGLSARITGFLAQQMPTLMRLFYAQIFTPLVKRYPDMPLKMLAGTAPPADLAALQHPMLQTMLRNSLEETFRQGGRGPTLDLMLLSRRWDIDLSAIGMKVLLWHGEEDSAVPLQMAQSNVRLLQNCDATFFPEEGHFSLPVNQMRTILTALTNGTREQSYNAASKQSAT